MATVFEVTGRDANASPSVRHSCDPESPVLPSESLEARVEPADIFEKLSPEHGRPVDIVVLDQSTYIESLRRPDRLASTEEPGLRIGKSNRRIVGEGDRKVLKVVRRHAIVCREYDEKITAYGTDSVIESRNRAAVRLMVPRANPGDTLVENRRDYRLRLVGTSIVDDQDLVRWPALSENAVDCLVEKPAVIVARNHHTDR